MQKKESINDKKVQKGVRKEEKRKARRKNRGVLGEAGRINK